MAFQEEMFRIPCKGKSTTIMQPYVNIRLLINSSLLRKSYTIIVKPAINIAFFCKIVINFLLLWFSVFVLSVVMSRSRKLEILVHLIRPTALRPEGKKRHSQLDQKVYAVHTGGTPRKNGWGVRRTSWTPYFRPKYLIFPARPYPESAFVCVSF